MIADFSRVLVTGASGFIGSRLVQLLLSETAEPSQDGFEILALVRARSAPGSSSPNSYADQAADNRPHLTFVTGDLTEPVTLNFDEKDSGAGLDSMIDVVYHLAAVTPESKANGKMLRAVNLDGTKNLFHAVSDRAKHFVYASGVAVFDPTTTTGTATASGDLSGSSNIVVINEETPKGSGMEYIKIRLEAEEFLRENCEKSGINLTVVYFPDIVYANSGSFRRIFLEQISKGKFRIPGSGDYHVNFIHREDAANILLAVAAKKNPSPKAESFIASDSEPAPFREFVNYIADQFGKKHPGSVPLFLAKAAVGSDLINMLTRNARASNEKISKIYQLQYPSFRSGIPQVVSEFKAGR